MRTRIILAVLAGVVLLAAPVIAAGEPATPDGADDLIMVRIHTESGRERRELRQMNVDIVRIVPASAGTIAANGKSGGRKSDQRSALLLADAATVEGVVSRAILAKLRRNGFVVDIGSDIGSGGSTP